MIGRVYLDPGDRLTGPIDPPMPVTILKCWRTGNYAYPEPPAAPPGVTILMPPRVGGPRNVLVRRTDGELAVIPFYRRLRIPREPVDLSRFPMHVHRSCNWPGCPNLMDAVSVLAGDPGYPEGEGPWFNGPLGLRLCYPHAHRLGWDTGQPGHLPRIVGDQAMACTCGRPLPWGATGAVKAAYLNHVATPRTVTEIHLPEPEDTP